MLKDRMDIAAMLSKPAEICPVCGKLHAAGVREAYTEAGAIRKIPAILHRDGSGKPFLLADENTWKAAGEHVASLLQENGIPYTAFLLNLKHPEPDEFAIGSVASHFDFSCDTVIGIGSGVINDLGKIIAHLTSRPYIIVGTAPSMDGYASATSSVIRDGLKYSLPSKCADTVIGDTDILCQAPLRMIQAGVGDLLAKFISIAEWRLSAVINGEYYCERIAEMVNRALDTCIANLPGIRTRDPAAITAVMDGMVLSGIAANYAGVSRPVSGMEHYLSHICDMRGVEFGKHTDLHGIQCGVATVTALRVYEKLRDYHPNREKALARARAFRYENWECFLREQLGNSAEAMVRNEQKEGKYDIARHAARLEVILANWDEILKIIRALPTAAEAEELLRSIGAPTSFAEIGFTKEEERNALLMSKDIRDKYVGSRLLWDLGIAEEVAAGL